MDFVTHALIGANVSRLFVRRPGELPALALAGVLASTLMDGDSWVALLGPGMYGRWHRVVSHSLIGLVGCALLAVAIARLAWRFPPARRFGWFVSANLPCDAEPVLAGAGRMMALCVLCALAHGAADAITGFGNMLFLWPFDRRDFSLHAVTSFDPFLFSLTMGWHLLLRRNATPVADERWIALAWLALAAGYVWARMLFSTPTVW